MCHDASVPGAIDFKRTLDSYRARSGQFRILDVPPMQYLMIDGSGDPNTSPEFQHAVSTLYPIAYTLKFASRRRLERDYTVPPLEALWWSDVWSAFTSARDKGLWKWTLMLMTPDWITRGFFDDAVATVRAKHAPPLLDAVRLESLDEGRCVQTLHLGPFDDEGPVLAELHDRFIPEQGLRMRGLHHEIYFSDLRTVAPEKFRTILRQPVEAAGR
jgi:hypothetical protein